MRRAASFLAIFLSQALLAHAQVPPSLQARSEGGGVREGHGGLVFSCVDEAGRVLSSQVVDLFLEGDEHVPRQTALLTGEALLARAPLARDLAAAHPDWPMERVLSYAAIERLQGRDPGLYESLRRELDRVFTIREFRAGPLPLLLDYPVAGGRFLLYSLGPAETYGRCTEGHPSWVQAATYLDRTERGGSQLTFCLEAWKSVRDELHRAALNVHEAVYRFFRDERESPFAPKVWTATGDLFAEVPEETLLARFREAGTPGR
jgi:hypothetical protein